MGDLYCVQEDVTRLSYVKGENHGKPWSPTDYETLRTLFLDGATLAQLCATLGRTGISVISKLKSLHLLREGPNGTVYHVAGEAKVLQESRRLEGAMSIKTTKETNMTGITSNLLSTYSAGGLISDSFKAEHAKPTETLKLLYGRDIEKLSEDLIIEGLRKAQATVKSHQELPENKYSAKRIAEAQQAIELAVAELNLRAGD